MLTGVFALWWCCESLIPVWVKNSKWKLTADLGTAALRSCFVFSFHSLSLSLPTWFLWAPFAPPPPPPHCIPYWKAVGSGAGSFSLCCFFPKFFQLEHCLRTNINRSPAGREKLNTGWKFFLFCVQGGVELMDLNLLLRKQKFLEDLLGTEGMYLDWTVVFRGKKRLKLFLASFSLNGKKQSSLFALDKCSTSEMLWTGQK